MAKNDNTKDTTGENFDPLEILGGKKSLRINETRVFLHLSLFANQNFDPNAT